MLKSVEKLGERERHIIIIAVAALLVILAVAVMFVSGLSQPAAGLARCNGIILAQQRYSCISSLALAQGNASMCTALPAPGSDTCAIAVESATGSASACSAISNASQYKYECVLDAARSLRNVSYCAMLMRPQMDQCVYAIAQAENFSEPSMCGTISNASLRTMCTSVVDYRDAIEYGNATYCEMLPASSNATILATMLGNSSDAFSTAFDYNEIGGTPRDYCYSQVALATNDSLLCSSIASSDARSECSGSLAYRSSQLNTTNITRFCHNSSLTRMNSTLVKEFAPVLKLACTTSNAIVSKNVTVCNELSNTTQQYSCIISYAHDLNDTSVCSLITNASESQACVVDAGGYGGVS